MSACRLDKYLSLSGQRTRSEAARLIRSGCVQVNGAVVKDPAAKVGDGAEVLLSGQSVRDSTYQYYLVYKPAGVLTAARDSRAQTVMDLLPPALVRRKVLPEGSPVLKPSKDERAYITDVLSGVEKYEEELDSSIAKHSTGAWTLDRVAHVDLSILRLAAYEMYHRDDVPDNVSISEAMNMAGTYSDPKSSRYINGVLGAMERDKHEAEA